MGVCVAVLFYLVKPLPCPSNHVPCAPRMRFKRFVPRFRPGWCQWYPSTRFRECPLACLSDDPSREMAGQGLPALPGASWRSWRGGTSARDHWWRRVSRPSEPRAIDKVRLPAPERRHFAGFDYCVGLQTYWPEWLSHPARVGGVRIETALGIGWPNLRCVTPAWRLSQAPLEAA